MVSVFAGVAGAATYTDSAESNQLAIRPSPPDGALARATQTSLPNTAQGSDSLDRTPQHNDGTDPTRGTYSAFYRAYEFLNAELFSDELPGALFSLQRRRNSRGYFSFSRFGHRSGNGEIVDEIALNPATFDGRTNREITSTVLHEMAHQWQFHFGKAGRRGYHNKQWAAKMIEVGLVPSHTGEPGGKQTGQRMTHFIDEGGPFDLLWQQLAARGFRLDYQDQIVARPVEPKRLKVRYACPSCSIHVGGKPDLKLTCDEVLL